MGFDTAYEAITEEVDDHRWAFGTGFTDPMTTVDTSVPDGVDPADLGAYCLMLGDDALIMSHRLQQWLTRAPELEEETALANIALDLLGQARLLLTRAGQVDGTARNEDDLAYLRGPDEFRNVRFVEPADGDFGALVVRLLLFTCWRLAMFVRLRDSRDPVLAAIAAKGINEITYHRDYAAGWVVRLADGTAYSRARIDEAIRAIAPSLAELFVASELERRMAAAGVGADPEVVRTDVQAVLADVRSRAGAGWIDGLTVSGAGGPVGPSGRAGVHTDGLGEILDELQSVARANAGGSW
jgi:ring-1,2-phenylacetyl-CoA epoxidase subunit PaaC